MISQNDIQRIALEGEAMTDVRIYDKAVEDVKIYRDGSDTVIRVPDSNRRVWLSFFNLYQDGSLKDAAPTPAM